jgi:hypothetical protein
MSSITAETSMRELAAIVSQALHGAGIAATLSGGGAVSLYSDNEYVSYDLDFVSSERLKAIGDAIGPLGFHRVAQARQFEHADTPWFVEFPPGPLAFGETQVSDDDACILQTAFGPVRVVTPTQIVMDRVAAYVHWHDNPSLDQAVMVASRQRVHWPALDEWAAHDRIDAAVIDDLRRRVDRAHSASGGRAERE